MTVCIAALCDKGKGAVVCADREITVAGFSLEFEHHESKIDRIADQCVVLSAGDALLATEIIEKTRGTFDTPRPTVRQIAEKIRDIYIQIHLDRAERVILRPRGLGWEEFKNRSAGLPLQGYLNIDNTLFNFGLGVVEFLIVGTDDTGAHAFRVHYNGLAGGDWMEWCDKLGYRAIGSGCSHATIWLSLEGQHRELTAAQTLFNVYCSKKTAESAPGVGRETDLYLIQAAGIEKLSESVFAQLEAVRRKTKTDPDASELQRIYEQRADANA